MILWLYMVYSFSLVTRLTAPYAAPFTACAAACPYEPLAFDNDSAMNVGMAVISFTTEI